MGYGPSTNMDVWKFISDKYTAGVEVMLLYVLHSEGSSPGRQGFKMAVAADGDFQGTIGGGIMEYKFVEMAKARLREMVNEAAVYNQIHDKAAGKDQSGMICSGEQTIFIYQVQRSDIRYINGLIDSLAENRNGQLKLRNNSIRFLNETPSRNFSFEQEGEDFTLIEKTGYKNILHIVGGGHCALALSRIMREMDFYIHVYDEREGLNTVEQNTFAHKKTIVKSYTDIEPYIESGDNVYVVIMTFGYRTDDIAVRAVLGNRFKYFGILGSRSKLDKLFTDYRRESISEVILSEIHAPIGMQIKSQTTAEIAVSIAAEIIGVKNDS